MKLNKTWLCGECLLPVDPGKKEEAELRKPIRNYDFNSTLAVIQYVQTFNSIKNILIT